MTLEDILNMLGSKNPFLEKVKVDNDGHKQLFTETGAISYQRLIEVLYAVGELTGTDMENIVETLDGIANEE